MERVGIDVGELTTGLARYDGYADWYDEWATTTGAPAMAAAQAALTELLPTGPGLAVDVGCGTGLHADPVRRAGFRLVGVDYSADQLRIARQRMQVVRADAGALPLAGASAQLVLSMFTHTDVEDFQGLVRECLRVLAPGGSFLYVGVHPCFVSPFAERLPDGMRVHPGYRQGGWAAPTSFTGDAVRRRVGVHHLPLEQLFTALLQPGFPIDRVLERGGGPVPDFIAVRVFHTER